jgi:hypothetical protein
MTKQREQLTTTLNRIREHHPCTEGWEKLLKHLGKTQADDEPLPYSTIVESNGLMDALWCCRAEPRYDKEWRLFAVWCARQVHHLMRDRRSITALDAAYAAYAAYVDAAAAYANAVSLQSKRFLEVVGGGK